MISKNAKDSKEGLDRIVGSAQLAFAPAALRFMGSARSAFAPAALRLILEGMGMGKCYFWL